MPMIEVVRRTLRFAIVYVATVVVVLGLAPNSAQAGPREDIWDIVAQAAFDNQDILNSFTTAATGSTSIAELDAARAVAHAQLDDVWHSAVGALDAIADAHPEYEGDVAEAKAALTTDHNDAHAEIDTIYDAVYDARTVGSTTTTSTSSTSTTTTTRPQATTTTTTVPEATTTTSTSSTTTTVPSGAAVPPPPPNPPSSETPPAIDDPNRVLTAPPGLDAEAGSLDGTAGDHAPSSGGGRGVVSEMITSGVSQVLPPALARFTAAPFVVVEMLVMTLIDTIRTMILPFVAISLVMAVFLWSENRRERDYRLS